MIGGQVEAEVLQAPFVLGAIITRRRGFIQIPHESPFLDLAQQRNRLLGVEMQAEALSGALDATKLFGGGEGLAGARQGVSLRGPKLDLAQQRNRLLAVETQAEALGEALEAMKLFGVGEG